VEATHLLANSSVKAGDGPSQAKPERFMIGQEAIEWAESFHSWMMGQKAFLANLIDSSDKMRLSRTMYKYIEDSKLHGVSKADLTIKFQRYDRRTRDEAMSDLIIGEKIVPLRIKTSSRPAAYFFTKEFAVRLDKSKIYEEINTK
jgi:hypothetical protein